MNKINPNLHAYNKHFVSIKDLFFSKNLPNSILFSGEKGIGKKTFLLHFLNFVQLNSQEQKNYLNSYTLESCEVINKIANNELSNIRIVKKLDKSQNISIDQIRDIINFCSYSALEERPKFICIFNVEDFNVNASNSLLKILEQPPANTYFFLTRNSNEIINSTILSRCFKMNLKISETEKNSVFKKILHDFDLHDFNNFDIFNRFDTQGSKINRIKYIVENSLTNSSLIDIIFYCLNDFKKSKDRNCLIFAAEFAKNIFYNKSFLPNKKIYKLYEKFTKTINEILKFNTDVVTAINIIKKVA
jgi:DNA polymerase III subunit delta'